MKTIYYTKRFTSGILKGLDSPVLSLTASTEHECVKHIFKGKTGKDATTKTTYKIIDCSFQNYSR